MAAVPRATPTRFTFWPPLPDDLLARPDSTPGWVISHWTFAVVFLPRARILVPAPLPAAHANPTEGPSLRPIRARKAFSLTSLPPRGVAGPQTAIADRARPGRQG